MKSLYTLLFMSFVLGVSAQVEGTWRLAQIPGALAVGPTQTDYSWWSSSATDINSRACLFDDSVTFDANGNFIHYMDGNTWLEPFQGVTSEQCGSPVAPHDGNGPYTYVYTNNQLTVNGSGAHIGLAKVVNLGEISTGSPVPSSITYEITMSSDGDTMTVEIDYATGWWKFVYQKTSLSIGAPPSNYDVTFNISTDLITGNVSSDGIYIGGGFVGGHDALALDDSDGDGIWTGTATLPESGGHFTILNGNCSDWSCKEDISGQPCADAGNYNDRNHLVGGFSQDTTLNLQFGSCTTPTGLNTIENKYSIYPNPSNGIITIHTSNEINTVNIYNMIGNLVIVKNISSNQSTLNIENLTNGVYLMEMKLSDGSKINSKIIKK
ncbi:MAG: T9SS type A sorting domain-containing protein [Parvicellaceae bacterium]